MITALPEGQKTKPPPRRRKKQDQPAAVPEIAREAAHYCEDLHASISRRAYDFYAERGYRAGCALQDWLDAEREIVSREQPA
ncbi:DUF2934 domain-containing protein [Petrachloros mirabilis]